MIPENTENSKFQNWLSLFPSITLQIEDTNVACGPQQIASLHYQDARMNSGKIFFIPLW
jgi:hypothetical protein